VGVKWRDYWLDTPIVFEYKDTKGVLHNSEKYCVKKINDKFVADLSQPTKESDCSKVVL
jgi:hypothetical protein